MGQGVMTYPVIIDAKLDEEISDFLLKFALSQHKDQSKFTSNGPSRQFCKLNDHQNLFAFNIDKLTKTVFNSINLYKIQKEPLFGVFVGVNNEGGAIHQHTDPAPDGYIHTRINFLLSKPSFGGMPIINDIEYSIEEKSCWINLASVWRHASTPVIGKKNRVVLSVGALVEEEELHNKFSSLFK